MAKWIVNLLTSNVFMWLTDDSLVNWSVKLIVINTDWLKANLNDWNIIFLTLFIFLLQGNDGRLVSKPSI